jgi:uncharacterized protein (TIGR02285 family)
MRSGFLLHALILALLVTLVPRPAQAQGDVTAPGPVLWLKTEWPPVFMQSGKGFGDQAMAWLIERLPAGYSHDIRTLPLARLLKQMEDPLATICTSNLLRTPARETQFLISHDIMRMPALGLVVRSSDVTAFAPLRDSQGLIEFRRVLEQTQLDGVFNENRSYGPALDVLLRAAPIARLPKTSGMVSMLAANRVDWVLLYPFEAIWLARQEQTAPVLATLPIAELPPFNDGGVTCNRTPMAARLIGDIDRILAAHPDEPWLKPMLEWLDPETRKRVSTRR